MSTQVQARETDMTYTAAAEPKPTRELGCLHAAILAGKDWRSLHRRQGAALACATSADG